MAGEILKDVTVTFEKAFKGDDVQVAKKGDDWTLYKFSATFKDETGQTKKHTTKSFTHPGPVGTSMVGSLELYHGDGPNGPYISYTFEPDEGQKAAPAPRAAPQAAQTTRAPVPTSIPYEAREAAVRRLLREGYNAAAQVMREIMDDTPKEKKASAAKIISGGFVEIWKCAIMSLKIDGNAWPDILQTERNRIAERDGMPSDADIEAVLGPDPVKKLVEATGGAVAEPVAKVDDLSDCPF